MPAAFRLSYQPELVDRAFRQWAAADYDDARLPDIMALAYGNEDLRQDVYMWLAAVDYMATTNQQDS